MKGLESEIGIEKLEIFNKHNSLTWTGPQKDASLFELWYSLSNPTNMMNNPENSKVKKKLYTQIYKYCLIFIKTNNFFIGSLWCYKKKSV